MIHGCKHRSRRHLHRLILFIKTGAAVGRASACLLECLPAWLKTWFPSLPPKKDSGCEYDKIRSSGSSSVRCQPGLHETAKNSTCFPAVDCDLSPKPPPCLVAPPVNCEAGLTGDLEQTVGHTCNNHATVAPSILYGVLFIVLAGLLVHRPQQPAR